MVTLLIALQIWCLSKVMQIWCLSKVRTRSADRKGDFGNFFNRFHQKPIIITLHIT